MGIHTIYVLSINLKIIEFFLSENFQFLAVKYSIYLNRRVFVMIVLFSQYILQNNVLFDLYDQLQLK